MCHLLKQGLLGLLPPVTPAVGSRPPKADVLISKADEVAVRSDAHDVSIPTCPEYYLLPPITPPTSLRLDHHHHQRAVSEVPTSRRPQKPHSSQHTNKPAQADPDPGLVEVSLAHLLPSMKHHHHHLAAAARQIQSYSHSPQRPLRLLQQKEHRHHPVLEEEDAHEPAPKPSPRREPKPTATISVPQEDLLSTAGSKASPRPSLLARATTLSDWQDSVSKSQRGNRLQKMLTRKALGKEDSADEASTARQGAAKQGAGAGLDPGSAHPSPAAKCLGKLRRAVQEKAAQEGCDLTTRSSVQADDVASVAGSIHLPTSDLKSPPSRKKEEDLLNAFRRLRIDNELHWDDLPRALELARFPKPNPTWIELAYGIFSRYSTLNQEEFITFARGYESLQREARYEAFQKLDQDRRSQAAASELGNFMKRFGMDPMRHVLTEAVSEADKARRGRLDFEQFQQVIELVLEREGFTRKDHELFMSVFSKFENQRCGSGRIVANKFVSILSWLGFSWSEESATKVVREVDVDRSGFLNKAEFLSCLRKVREQELQKIKLTLMGQAMDSRGRIPAGELEGVFRVLGYVPDCEAIEEAARDCGVALEGDLDLVDLWQILTIYRSREGFSSVEEREIQEAFAQIDPKGAGAIDALDVGRLMCLLGSPTNFEVRQDIISRIDVAGKGRLDYVDVRKFVRMARDQEKVNIQKVFAAREGDHQGTIPKSCVHDLLDTLNLVDVPEVVVRHLLSNLKASVSFADFANVASRLSKATRSFRRDHGGFSIKELRSLKAQFRRCDRDGNGEIQNGELLRVIDRLFPVFARSQMSRQELEDMFKEVDANGNGSLDFMDFTHLVVKAREMQDQLRLQKERSAITKTGLSKAEVRQFRELFLDYDEGDGELSLASAEEMICTVVPMDNASLEEFRAIFREVTPQQHSVEGRPDHADFPQFLLLMRKIIDINFGRINERSQRLILKPKTTAAAAMAAAAVAAGNSLEHSGEAALADTEGE